MKFIKNTSSHWVLRFVLGGLSALFSACDMPSNLPAPGDRYFIKYYGEDGDQIAVDMVVNSDGTIVLLGKSATGPKRIFVTKVNPAGTIVWQRNFGGPTDEPKDIEPTFDGNYVIVSDYLGEGNTKDAKLLRITPAGIEIDSAINGTTGNDIVNSITPLTDGGFVIAGFTDYNPNPAVYKDRISSFLHFRCDASLTFFKDEDGLWNDVDGYNGEGVTVSGSINACTKIFEQPNNSFYVFGYSNTNYFNTNNKTILFYYKLNEAGLSNPNYLYNTPEDIESSFVTTVPSTLLKGYFVVSTANKNTGTSKLHVSKLKDPLKFDEVEDKQFDQNILGTQNLSGVYATPSLTAPQGYLVLSNETDETGQTNVLLSKVNQSGDEVWSANFGSSRNDTAAAVAELPDGKILILCTVQLDIQLKMALIKVNSKGQFLK